MHAFKECEHHIDFCPNCRKYTHYQLKKEPYRLSRGNTALVTVAVCDQCKQPMVPHGLIDYNIAEITEQARKIG